ncbi:peroxisomal targeting signal 2 receptor [Coelomomyces lativittatus]|nr:peroxisomal targeting signal 2 receptor [Coelomomyces lativittatus]KAJ1511404.1 peroxisomal targeting signal 2 receptor [Coelomomyces lativittatus]KAJ1516869.1 peroxisomal targeting signal 2 receptor [Coelomomyces lativittatus]
MLAHSSINRLGEVSSIQSPIPETILPSPSIKTPIPQGQFKTPGFHGFAVEFSPFTHSQIAVATSINYGISGDGRLWIHQFNPEVSEYIPLSYFDTKDALFDVSWNELNKNQVATAGGDGSIKLWDITLPQGPINIWKDHFREVFSLIWNPIQKDQFVSASWDTTIKLWSINHNAPFSTLNGHKACVFTAVPSPSHPHMLASGSSDQTIRLWDHRLPHHVLHFHHHDVLTLDWDKYEPYLYSGSADRSIFQIDLRKHDQPISQVTLTMPIRRIKSSPHFPQYIASVGYDTSIHVWKMGVPRPQLLYYTDRAHTEFIPGIDFSLQVPGLMVTCGWDSQVILHKLLV